MLGCHLVLGSIHNCMLHFKVETGIVQMVNKDNKKMVCQIIASTKINKY